MDELVRLTEALLAEVRISNELKTIQIKLQAVTVTKNMRGDDQIELLARAGLKPRQIADALGKTPNYVSVTLHKLRKIKSKDGK